MYVLTTYNKWGEQTHTNYVNMIYLTIGTNYKSTFSLLSISVLNF